MRYYNTRDITVVFNKAYAKANGLEQDVINLYRMTLNNAVDFDENSSIISDTDLQNAYDKTKPFLITHEQLQTLTNLMQSASSQMLIQQ